MDRQSLTALFTLHLILLGPTAILPILLLVHGETEAGRWVGLALTSLVLGTLTPWLFVFQKTRRAGKAVAGLSTLLIIVSFSKAFLLTPGHSDV